MDGVDAALIKSDGTRIEDTGKDFFAPYSPELRKRLRAIVLKGNISKIELLRVEKEVTIAHASAVNALLTKSGVKKSKVDLIGFHGQTIAHFPGEGITWQIGNPSLLAELTGIDVVSDFRRHDMAAGGQGAPLVPFFHAAIASKTGEPIVMLNIGGVANVTYIEKNLPVIAFDTGPGCALLDDWIFKHSGKHFDDDGGIASDGKVDKVLLKKLLSDPYFNKKPPKSLDRQHFAYLAEDLLKSVSLKDGAAILAALTVGAVVKACDFFPKIPKKWFVCGGGRHNEAIMSGLKKNLKGKVEKIESLGFNGDMLEAQAFGFLAVRSHLGMPLTLPETTGVKRPATGGAFYQA